MENTAGEMLIAILVVSAVIAGGFQIMAAYVPADPIATSTFNNYTTVYDKFNEIKNNSLSLSNTVKKQNDVKPGLLGIVDAVLSNSLGALQQIWTSLTVVTGMLDALSNSYFGVPLWFSGLLTILITIIVTFAILAAWFKWRI